MRFAVALTLMLAAVVLFVYPRPAAAQQPSQAGTYVGTLTGCESLLGQAYWFEVGDGGHTITNIHAVSGIVPNLDIPVSIPISQDGTFAADFSVAGIARVVLEGRFVGDTVSGTYSVDFSGVCGGTFSAQRGDPPTPAPTSTPRPPEPQLLRAVLQEYDGCGGGTLSITVAANRRSIIHLSAADISGDGVPFTGAADFPEGAVPISEEGLFGWVYMPGDEPGQEIAINGTYEGGAAQGLLTVSPSSCQPIPFEAGPVPGPPQPGGSLPDVGTGSGTGSGVDALLAIVLVGIGGAAASLFSARRLLRP